MINNISYFTVSYIAATNNIKIALDQGFTSWSFYILSPDDLKTKFNGLFHLESYDVSNPHDCNELLSNLDGPSVYCDSINPFVGFLNMNPINNLYLHSSSLGNLNNVGCRNENTIIKKIAVTAGYNNVVFNNITVFNDYNSCSGQTSKKIDFQLKLDMEM